MILWFSRISVCNTLFKEAVVVCVGRLALDYMSLNFKGFLCNLGRKYVINVDVLYGRCNILNYCMVMEFFLHSL